MSRRNDPTPLIRPGTPCVLPVLLACLLACGGCSISAGPSISGDPTKVADIIKAAKGESDQQLSLRLPHGAEFLGTFTLKSPGYTGDSEQTTTVRASQ